MNPPSKRRKLSHSMAVRQLADNLHKTDMYNIDSWMRIIHRVDREKKLDDQRYVLTLFLSIFPTAARQWKYYIEVEMMHQHYTEATDLFKSCLGAGNKCYDVELYHLYITLCGKINESQSKDFRLKSLKEAFCFVLKCVGQDIASTSLWRKYVNFLKSNSSVLTTKHGIKDIKLEIRALYHRMIRQPINECDKLWDEYIEWEKSLNAQLAEAYHDKLKHVHETTKQCYLERKRRRRGILLNVDSVPSHSSHAQQRNCEQIELWKGLLDFELLNKQGLSASDLVRRMEFTFRQSLMTMSLFPDIWILYIEWTQQHRTAQRVEAVFKQCLQRLPNCLLIHFKYLEWMEMHKTHQDTDQQYHSLMDDLPDNTLVRIAYLHYLRRKQSSNAARNFFVNIVLEDPNRFWQLYVATARIEEQLNCDAAAAYKVFNSAFKYFKDRPQFVICFVDFLMQQTTGKLAENAKVELRHIFSDILPQLDSQQEHTRRIWTRFIEFEGRGAITASDVAVLHRAEQKRDHSLDCNRTERLLNAVERFSFLDLLPVTKQYRDTLVHAQHAAQSKAARQLKAMQNKNMLNTRHRLSADGRGMVDGERRIVSGIKLDAFERTLSDPMSEGQSDWMDVTTLMDDNGSGRGPQGTGSGVELQELIAFRPGVRFLAKIEDEEEEDVEEEERGDGRWDEVLRDYPKLKELMQKLPPPPQTQLLYLEKMDRNTKMIDPDSFLTFMKLKLSSIL